MLADSAAPKTSVAERINDTAGVIAALQRARREALREHALAGHKVPIWRDGRVVWVLPTLDGEIPVDEAAHR